MINTNTNCLVEAWS